MGARSWCGIAKADYPHHRSLLSVGYEDRRGITPLEETSRQAPQGVGLDFELTTADLASLAWR